MSSCKRLAWLSALALALTCLPTDPATAESFLFPPEWQTQPGQYIAYSVPGGRIEIRDLSIVTNCAVSLPLSYGSSREIGYDHASVEFSLSTDSGATWTPYSNYAACEINAVARVAPPPSSIYWTMEFEVLGIGIGEAFPPDIWIRETPALVSTGSAELTLGSGGWIMSSFVDVFTDLSLDGGLSWKPCDQVSVNGGKDWIPSNTMRLIGVPEPGTFTILAAGLAGILGFVWRRRKRTLHQRKAPSTGR